MMIEELKKRNPWMEFSKNYQGVEFLYSDEKKYLCDCDKGILESYNEGKSEEDKFVLGVPAFPWYGNPLTAKVIILSLNPAYNDRQKKIIKMIQRLDSNVTKGFTDHLRNMLTFDVNSFLPTKDDEKDGLSSRDIANIHQSWYWQNKLIKAFISREDKDNNDDKKNPEKILEEFENINNKVALIQLVPYSSKYKPHLKVSEDNGLSLGKFGKIPSWDFTRDLIEYILTTKEDVIFIVARSEKEWKSLIGTDLWNKHEKRHRFVLSNNYRSQYFSFKRDNENNVDDRQIIMKTFEI